MRTACRRVIGLLAACTAVAAVALPAGAWAATSAASRAHAAGDRCPDADTLPSKLTIAEAQAATLCLINAERGARGLRPLRPQTTLARSAGGFAQLMAEQGFFAHTSPGGSTLLSRVKASSYLGRATRWSLGENIAWGTERLATPRATVKSWMTSPPHRSNLLASHFTDVGIGLAAGGGPANINPDGLGTTYVTDFGQRTVKAQFAKHAS